MAPQSENLNSAEQKKNLRQQMARRLNVFISSSQREAADGLINAKLRTILLSHKGLVAAFWPRFDEPQIQSVITELLDWGHPVAFPRVKGNMMDFAAITALNQLMTGPFNVQQPHEELPVADPDLVLVPLVAFDDQGHRLGRGMGYYDRALASLSALNFQTLGLAYDVQNVSTIPCELHDVKLNAVMTESHYFKM